MPPQEAIMIAATNNRAIFAALATTTMCDLSGCGTNQPTRAIPRRQS
ncbi:MAG: hypothetical protein OXF75_03350 [Acidimicrobiaceae bacterium]|nr:hypothetical protein [Acidimicrobiaceae bacterium]